MAVNLNITDRKQTEEALRLPPSSCSSSSSRAVRPSSSPTPRHRPDLQSGGGAALRRLGAPKAPRSGRRTPAVAAGRDAAAVRGDRALSRGAGAEGGRGAVAGRPPDGSRRTLVGGSAPLRRPDGTLAGGVLMRTTTPIGSPPSGSASGSGGGAQASGLEASSRVKTSFSTLRTSCERPSTRSGWAHACGR